MCAPAFRRRQAETFGTVITSAARDLLARWRPVIAAGTPVRMDHDLTALTLQVVVTAMFGPELAGLGEQFGRAVDAVNSFISRYAVTPGSLIGISPYLLHRHRVLGGTRRVQAGALRSRRFPRSRPSTGRPPGRAVARDLSAASPVPC
jgi:hypothetical protein